MSDRTIWLREHARRHAYDRAKGTGTVYFNECSLCGWLDWMQSSAEPQDQLVPIVAENSLDPFRCQPCNEVMRRAPEVFGWVRAVVAKAASATEARSAETRSGSAEGEGAVPLQAGDAQ
jgi:hypothetical protein